MIVVTVEVVAYGGRMQNTIELPCERYELVRALETDGLRFDYEMPHTILEIQTDYPLYCRKDNLFLLNAYAQRLLLLPSYILEDLAELVEKMGSFDNLCVYYQQWKFLENVTTTKELGRLSWRNRGEISEEQLENLGELIVYDYQGFFTKNGFYFNQYQSFEWNERTQQIESRQPLSLKHLGQFDFKKMDYQKEVVAMMERLGKGGF